MAMPTDMFPTARMISRVTVALVGMVLLGFLGGGFSWEESYVYSWIIMSIARSISGIRKYRLVMVSGSMVGWWFSWVEMGLASG